MAIVRYPLMFPRERSASILKEFTDRNITVLPEEPPVYSVRIQERCGPSLQRAIDQNWVGKIIDTVLLPGGAFSA